MTTAIDTPPKTARGLLMHYPDVTYRLSELGDYFTRVDALWEQCLDIAFIAQLGDTWPHIGIRSNMRIAVEFQNTIQSLSQSFTEAEVVRRLEVRAPSEEDTSLKKRAEELVEILIGITRFHRKSATVGKADRPFTPTLTVSRLQLSSPLELTVTTADLAGTGAFVYAFHLLAKILRNPAAIGSWLPTVQASWYAGIAERDRAKEERVVAEQMLAAQLARLNANSKLLPLKPTNVEAIGIGEPPLELAEELTDLS